ncbi:hypothetical protein ACPWT1_08030 [Ramlibacter sp. MMS24-I3-19]|uniref:hypothetical protein n=1 Tax=Ramlibacter sp. MMS24-I3-19 TaxID=3416606 RepID=UPI003D033B6B
MSATSLPASYRGHDCFSIASALEKLQTSKSEFETASEYQARIAALGDVQIGKQLRLGDRLAFPLESAFLKYSAEERTANLTVLPVPTVNVLDFKVRQAVKLDERKRKTREYVGSNAFGVTRDVTDVTSEICGLALLDRSFISLQSWGAAAVEMDPQAARLAKDSVSALLVGRLRGPMLAQGLVTTRPTLDNPTRRRSEGPVLVLELEDIWYFDRTTGRVLARAEADRGAREEAREKQRVRALAQAKGLAAPESPLTPEQSLSRCLSAITSILGPSEIRVPAVDQSSDRGSRVYRYAWGGSSPSIESGSGTPHKALCMVARWTGQLEYLEVDGRQIEQK